MEDDQNKPPLEEQINIEFNRVWTWEYLRHLRVEASSGRADQKTYTTVVVFGGYGAVFSLLYLTKGIIGPGYTAVAALAFGLSILTFVSHELYRTWIEGNESAKAAEALSNQSVQEALAAFDEQQRQKLARFHKYYPWWRFQFVVSVVFGVGAMVMVMLGLIDAVGWAFWTAEWWQSVLNSR